MRKKAGLWACALFALLAFCFSPGSAPGAFAGVRDGFFPLPERIGKSSGERADLNEWRRYLGKKAAVADIREAVGAATLEELQKVKESRAGDSGPFKAAKNLFARKEARDGLDLLILERRAERLMADDGQMDASGFEELSRQGRELHKRARSAFVKGRVGLMLVRLASRAGRDGDAVAFYDRHLPPKLDAGRARWRALERKGASLKKLGVTEDVNRLLASAVAGAPEVTEDATLTFIAPSAADWQRLLKSCANDSERAAAHTLLALSTGADIFPAIKYIHSVAPANPALLTLIALETRRIESSLARSPEFASGAELSGTEGSREAARLAEFLGRALARGGEAEPETWRLAFAYNSLLSASKSAPALSVGSGEGARTEAALATFADAVRSNRPDDARAMRMVRMAGVLEPEEVRDALTRLTLLRLSGVYRAGGQPGLAGLMKARADSPGAPGGLSISRDPAFLADLAKLLAEAENGPLTQYLLNGGRVGAASTDGWLALAGGYEFSSGRYAEAKRLFARISDAGLKAVLHDPFRIEMCGESPPGEYVADKAAIAGKMEEIETTTGKGGVEAGRALLTLGVVRYNTSYFGKAREMGSPVWTAELIDEALPEDPWFDLTGAVKSLLRAEELLRASEPELAAKCAFMLARCKADKVAEVKGGPPNPIHRTMVGEQTQKLKTIYADTEFAKRVLRECGFTGE